MAITIRGLPRTVAVTVVPGGAAGAHAVDGNIAPGDDILSVRHLSDDLVTNADVTGEFSITDHNEIDNDLGTDTTGDFLVVTYAKAAGN